MLCCMLTVLSSFHQQGDIETIYQETIPPAQNYTFEVFSETVVFSLV